MIYFGSRRNKMIKDERIQSSMRHIASQCFVIWFFLMLASLLYRQFYLKQPIEQYWDLAAIFFIGTMFVSISIFNRGAVHENAITRLYKWMVPFIIIGVVASNYILGNIASIKQLIVTIISTVIGISIVMVVFYILYKRWESKI